MKTLTVRLPAALVADIDAESRIRGMSRSDVVRERLRVAGQGATSPPPAIAAIADLVGSIEDLPADLSARRKEYLRATGYGRKRPR
ncbi:MAG: ribbon-helix-helix protein, CopG family [Burkholderiales bacterium]|nr:ribbon-helix-helix protein, CopG family [Burkholderiales bacterium]